jgi:F-type H+-transporting ATPase subunit alpha
VEEVGTVLSVGRGIAGVRGLPGVKADELLRFSGNKMGFALNLDPDRIGVVLLDENEAIAAGAEVRGTGRVLDVPVGDSLLGRIVDAVGRPLDGKGPLSTSERMPIEREAPAIMDRSPVEVPIQTGLQAVDALIPIGRGQRELILGDRQTGKTAIALDTLINQADKDVLCIYCAIGQRSSATAKVIADLQEYGNISNCIVVVTTGEDPPGLVFSAPYAATTMAEYFRDQGRDVLIVYDDLTRHARAYRELSLLLRRPPAREAYPGDIFYIHSRLLERSTHLDEEHGGGTLTALPIVETEAQNLSAYIPTNLISITDGQVYLSPGLFRKGVLPAIDIGKSVSRVGGKTQLPAYRAVAGDLRLSYSQFEELEAFARFGTRLDPETKKTLARGRRVREVLKQTQYDPISVPEQIGVMLAVNEGVLDAVDLPDIPQAKAEIREAIRDQLPDLSERIMEGEELGEEERQRMLTVIRHGLGLDDAEPEEGDHADP